MPPGAAADHHQPAPPPPPSPRRGIAITPQSPLRIKQDGKFYERLLAKESSASAGNLSFRYYWAEPGSVPFVWETQPGTPRDVVAGLAAGALPVITPPPSYVLRHGTNSRVVAATPTHHEQRQGSKGKNKNKKRCRLKRIKIGFIAGIFRRLGLMNKAWRRPATPAKVSSSSRWLFCSVATEGGKQDQHENETAARRQLNTAMCGSFLARPRPWLPRFRSAGNRTWWQR